MLPAKENCQCAFILREEGRPLTNGASDDGQAHVGDMLGRGAVVPRAHIALEGRLRKHRRMLSMMADIAGQVQQAGHSTCRSPRS